MPTSHRFLLAFLSLIPVSLFSQTTARITGTILNSSAERIEIEVMPHFLSQRPSLYSAELDRNGRFDLSFPLSEAKMIGCFSEEIEVELYLEPGDHLQLSFDADNASNGPTFSGDEAAENEYMQAYVHTYLLDQDQEQGFFLHMQHDLPEDFMGFGQEYRANRMDFLQQFHEETPLSESFLRYCRQTYTYAYVEMMFQYREIYMNRAEREDLIALDQTYDTFLEGISFQEEDAITNPVYRNAVNAYLRYKFNQLLAERYGDYDLRESSADLIKMSKILFQGATRKMVLAGLYTDAMNRGMTEEMEQELDQFIEDTGASMPEIANFLEDRLRNAPADFQPEDDPE